MEKYFDDSEIEEKQPFEPTLEGEILELINKNPLITGIARKDIESLFIDHAKKFKSIEELRRLLKRMERMGLISHKMIRKEATIFLGDKADAYLFQHGYLDKEKARKRLRDSLINQRMLFDASGNIIICRKNLDTYFRICQTILHEISNKHLDMKYIAENCLKQYGNIQESQCESQIDVLLYRFAHNQL